VCNKLANSKASPAAFMQDNTLIAVIELGLSNWLVAGLIPGVSREPLKKLEPNPEDLLKLLKRAGLNKSERELVYLDLLNVACKKGAFASPLDIEAIKDFREKLYRSKDEP
jgi:hypothetical protein